MSHAEEVMEQVKRANRLELIIQEKDRIIAMLRNQLEREQEINRQLLRWDHEDDMARLSRSNIS